jgi:hypothetical protein
LHAYEFHGIAALCLQIELLQALIVDLIRPSLDAGADLLTDFWSN